MIRQNLVQAGELNAGKPSVVPHRRLETTAALAWLARGWQDFRAAPRVILTYGLMVFLITAAIAWLAWLLGGLGNQARLPRDPGCIRLANTRRFRSVTFPV